MLLRRKNREESNSSSSNPAPTPLSQFAAAQIPETIVGEHISIEGTIRANENIVIEGTVKGAIEAKSCRVTIGCKGKIDGDIDADSVVVSGRMIGNIHAKSKASIRQSADFTGSIKARRVAIDDGAFVKATIELSRDDHPAAPQPNIAKPIDAIVLVAEPANGKKSQPIISAMGK